MKQDELEKLTDSELDALVAEKVMGWERRDYIKANDAPVTFYMLDTDWDNGGGVFTCKPYKRKVPGIWFYRWHAFNPSTSWDTMREVIEKFDRREWDIQLTSDTDLDGQLWGASFIHHTPDGPLAYGHYDKTLPRAVCIAALMAIGDRT